MRTLVAIPIYNEALYLSDVLDDVRRYADFILAVNDGSTDGTAEILAAARDIDVIHHRTNLGYGQSLIDAFEFAQRRGFDWVITMDCDRQHEPSRIPVFMEAARRDDADVISGSRYLDTAVPADLPPADRRRINFKLTGLINERLNLSITDAFCGYKAHRVASMDLLNLSEPGYALPMQFWAQVARAGLRIREIPVRLIYNDPNRQFGGDLDDPEARLQHYLSVFYREFKGADMHRQVETGNMHEDSCCCGLCQQR